MHPSARKQINAAPRRRLTSTLGVSTVGFRSIGLICFGLLLCAAGAVNAGQMILPVTHKSPRTPETKPLTPQQADAVMRRDWLFQAMGQPLAKRAEREIAWARQLAGRLTGGKPKVILADELAGLDALARRLSKLMKSTAAEGATALPNWIWFPEGNPAHDAPIESRYFRAVLRIPKGANVKRGDLRIACDDTCEVFVNGSRIGSGGAWNRTATFAIDGKLLGVGENVLAVRGENKYSNVPNNPAGLIASLTISLNNGKRLTVVSDSTWRVAKIGYEGWTKADFDDSAWRKAAIAGKFGAKPWGRINGLLPQEAAYAYENPEVVRLYLDVRRLKRRIALKNPVLDFKRLLFIDQPKPQGSQVIHQSIHRMGISATPGGRLLMLDGLNPGGPVKLVAPDKPGSFWRPDLSFDAKRVLFCYKPHDVGSFRLYEIDIASQRIKQLTASDYDDIDPIYMPDGHILFTTTRANSYVRCGPFIYSYVLARCDADGRNVYIISNNSEPDFVPALMADGRVIYSRWEYTDKPLWRIQSLWTVNPDGTNVNVFWGNQSVWPDHVSQPRQIPGSQKVMFCGVGHHDWWSGSVGIIDPAKGFNFPNGLTKVTGDLIWPESGNGAVDPIESKRYHASGKFTGYSSPYPLSDKDFLVSARGLDRKFRLYLMDVDGNRELIFEGVHDVLHAMPVKARKKPPALPDRVIWPGTGKDRKPQAPGYFYSSNVYQGAAGLEPGSAKYLRVFQQDHKTYSTWQKTYRHSGPAISIVQEESVKRVLGVVPVRPDGTVYFKVPSGRAVFFQLLDENYRCLQTMRSFTGLMPGETRGCLGCHEMQNATPARPKRLPFGRGPADLTPPPWGDESIGYERFVQPVLDKYCGKCHQGKGKGRKKLDLTLRAGHGPFKEPYLTLVGPAGWGSPAKPGPGYGIAGAIPVEARGNYKTIKPRTSLSYTSKLIDIASSGKHNKVKVDPRSLRRLIAWVDACCPFRGEEEVRAIADPSFPGIEKLPVRPRVRTAPRINRP